MDNWNEYAFPKITARAKQDKVYLELLEENKKLEPEYMGIMENMASAEQEMIERYIASCEGMEFRFAQIAYQVGCSEIN